MKKPSAILVLGSALFLGGCGWFDGDDPDIVFDDRVGPNIKQLSRSLPDGLVGDEENRRYSGELLRAEEIFKPAEQTDPPNGG